MDEDEITSPIQACKLLKYKLSQIRFIIVNVSSSDSIGTHWTLLCRKKGNYIFAWTETNIIQMFVQQTGLYSKRV